VRVNLWFSEEREIYSPTQILIYLPEIIDKERGVYRLYPLQFFPPPRGGKSGLHINFPPPGGGSLKFNILLNFNLNYLKL